LFNKRKTVEVAETIKTEPRGEHRYSTSRAKGQVEHQLTDLERVEEKVTVKVAMAN